VFLLARTLVYATLFVELLLVWLPARILARSGLTRPATLATPQIAGMAIVLLGAALVFWCVSSFIRFGRGTPAPFDAPRHLVLRGPYRFVRNPMYMGAAIALCGAALFYRSAGILVYACVFLLVFHFFIVLYEEPTLRRSFGAGYENYCHSIHRWWPSLKAARRAKCEAVRTAASR
jgi:protein-S-isoprenylcysteine O-methyltransferase Ste14